MNAFVINHFGNNIKYLRYEIYFLYMLRNNTKNDIVYLYSINDTPNKYIEIILLVNTIFFRPRSLPGWSCFRPRCGTPQMPSSRGR